VIIISNVQSNTMKHSYHVNNIILVFIMNVDNECVQCECVPSSVEDISVSLSNNTTLNIN